MVEDEKIVVPELGIQAYLFPQINSTSEQPTSATTPVLVSEIARDTYSSNTRSIEDAVRDEHAPKVIQPTSMYASQAEIREIESLGYHFELFEAIVTTFTTRTRGLKGGFSFDHICKRVKNYKTRDKRRMVNRLVADGVVSFDGKKSYSLTGQINTAKHQPLRTYLKNYLQSKSFCST